MVYITNPYGKKRHNQNQLTVPNSSHSVTPIVGGHLKHEETKEDKIKKKNTTTIANLPPPPKDKAILDRSVEEKLKKFISFKIVD